MPSMIESAIFYPIAAFLGVLFSFAGIPHATKMSVNVCVIFLVPILWAIVCNFYYPSAINQESAVETANALFNARLALQAASHMHKMGVIYVVGSIFWFAALVQLLRHLTSRSRTLTS